MYDATHSKHHHTYWGQYTWTEKLTCTKTGCQKIYDVPPYRRMGYLLYILYIVYRQRATGGGYSTEHYYISTVVAVLVVRWVRVGIKTCKAFWAIIVGLHRQTGLYIEKTVGIRGLFSNIPDIEVTTGNCTCNTLLVMYGRYWPVRHSSSQRY